MENTFQKRIGLLILAAYLGVFAGTMSLVIGFRGKAQASHRSEELSYLIREKIQRFNALEWRAITGLPNNLMLMANIDHQRTALSEALDNMIQLNPGDEKLQLLQQTYADYKQATYESSVSLYPDARKKRLPSTESAVTLCSNS